MNPQELFQEFTIDYLMQDIDEKLSGFFEACFLATKPAEDWTNKEWAKNQQHVFQ